MKLIELIPTDVDKNTQHLGELPSRRVVTSFKALRTNLTPNGTDKTIRINGLEKSKYQI